MLIGSGLQYSALWFGDRRIPDSCAVWIWHNVILTSSWHQSDITNVTSSHSQTQPAITLHQIQAIVVRLWELLSLTHSWDRQNKDYCSKLSQNISRIVILWPQPIMMTPVSDSFIFYTLSTHQYQPDIQIFINITGDKVHHIPLLVSGPQRSVSFLPWM